MTDTSGAVTKTAGAVIDALKSQPLVLALLVFNLFVFWLVYSATQANATRNAEMLQAVLKFCEEKR